MSDDLKNGLSRMEVAAGEVEDVESAMAGLADLPRQIVDDAVDAAASSLRVVGMVYKMIRANYLASGIETRTGKLSKALSGVRVRGVMKGGAPVLRIAMKPKIKRYDNSKTSFYTAAASLNYGAVRAPKVMRAVLDVPTGRVKVEMRPAVGAKAKRTIKKVALGTGASRKAIEAVERAAVFKGGLSRKGFKIGTSSDQIGKSVRMSGGAVVLRPRPFFYLSQAQRAQVVRAFREEFGRQLGEALGLQAA